MTHLTNNSWAHTTNSVHYGNVIVSAMVSQITSLMIVYSTVYSDADQRKHQGSVSLAFVRGIHRGPVNSLHKRPVMRKMFPFDDVIMEEYIDGLGQHCSQSSVLAMELLQSCTKPLICCCYFVKNPDRLTSRNTFCITLHLCGESTRDHRIIPRKKGQQCRALVFS